MRCARAEANLYQENAKRSERVFSPTKSRNFQLNAPRHLLTLLNLSERKFQAVLFQEGPHFLHALQLRQLPGSRWLVVNRVQHNTCPFAVPLRPVL